VGAILVGASQQQLDALSHFAEAIGNAYQVVDDLRDQNEDALRAGNGNRASEFLLSYAESAGRVVSSLIDEAKQAIEIEFGRSEHSQLLSEITDFVRHRIPVAQLQSSN
jgi:geranylgeranyl pyrophosphate synthase